MYLLKYRVTPDSTEEEKSLTLEELEQNLVRIQQYDDYQLYALVDVTHVLEHRLNNAEP